MSYISIDEQCVNKIEKLAVKIDELYHEIEQVDNSQLEYNNFGLALTQCLINLYETIRFINSDDLALKLAVVQQKTKITRNIAAHDDGSINWSAIKKNCRLIITLITSEFINECYELCTAEQGTVKDYTGEV